MAQKPLQPNEVILKDVRLSFNDLFEAKAFQAGAQPRFSGTFLVPKGSQGANEVTAAVIAAIKSKFPSDNVDNFLARIKGNRNKFCVQDGDTSDYEGYAGHLEVRANNKIRPTVVDSRERGAAPLTESDGRPYSGCYVNAKLSFFAYDNSGKGVSASLMGVQFVRDGESFGGSRAADVSEFADLSDGADAPGNTAGSSLV